MSTTNWDKVRDTLVYFLEEHYDEKKTLLLGLSGGPDSICLLHCLLDCGVMIRVAHVDHGWREASKKESAILQEICEELKVPFHLKRLGKLVGNQENGAREARLKFFKEIVEKNACQAVILGHHADDRAETVLKRLLEGASITSLNSIPKIKIINGLEIWRPLYCRTKKEILRALDDKKITYFIDETNRDETYLRARFRERIIPTLAKQFGKEIASPLCQIADESEEIIAYLEAQVANYPKIFEKNALNFNAEKLPHPFEIKYIIKKFCKAHNLLINKTQLQTILKLVIDKSYDKKINVGEFSLRVHGRRILVGSK